MPLIIPIQRRLLHLPEIGQRHPLLGNREAITSISDTELNTKTSKLGCFRHRLLMWYAHSLFFLRLRKFHFFCFHLQFPFEFEKISPLFFIGNQYYQSACSDFRIAHFVLSGFRLGWGGQKLQCLLGQRTLVCPLQLLEHFPGKKRLQWRYISLLFGIDCCYLSCRGGFRLE